MKKLFTSIYNPVILLLVLTRPIRFFVAINIMRIIGHVWGKVNTDLYYSDKKEFDVRITILDGKLTEFFNKFFLLRN